MGDEEKQQQEAQSPVQETVDAGPSLLDEIMQETKIKPTDESYGVARHGLEAFLAHLIGQKGKVGAKQAAVTDMISEIDKKLSKQLNWETPGLKLHPGIRA